MDTIVFGNYSLKEILVVVLIIAGLWTIIRIFMRVFKKKENDQHFQSVKCFTCGWEGKVSKYSGRCPKCNQPLGDQRAKH
ncbi:MAG: hypothetical protein A2Y97_07090 [Nitrospirae bacterium RBG_13_39_12]|nr:MAG: hypothetical protein A2Y97_07090 [Nitrospirae bacterium RBG_13_39_12]